MRRLLPLSLLLFAPAAFAADDKLPAAIKVDKEKKTVSIDAKVAPRKVLDEVYPIEVIACWAYKKDPKPGDRAGKKAHETVLTIDVLPSDVAKAMEQLGAKAGKPGYGEDQAAEGPDVNIYIDVPQKEGDPKRLTLDKVLLDPKTKKPMPKGVKFKFTGSGPRKATGDQPEVAFGADASGSLIYIFPVDVETVFQSSLSMKDEKFLKLEVNKDVLPKEGDPVKLVIELAEKK
jgi:hypothetical protein